MSSGQTSEVQRQACIALANHKFILPEHVKSWSHDQIVQAISWNQYYGDTEPNNPSVMPDFLAKIHERFTNNGGKFPASERIAPPSLSMVDVERFMTPPITTQGPSNGQTWQDSFGHDAIPVTPPVAPINEQPDGINLDIDALKSTLLASMVAAWCAGTTVDLVISSGSELKSRGAVFYKSDNVRVALQGGGVHAEFIAGLFICVG